MSNFIEKDWKTHEFSNYMKDRGEKLNFASSSQMIIDSGYPDQQRWKDEKGVVFDNEKPHLWFDNFANIEKIQFNDLEIMQYKDLDVFKLYNHPPIISSLKEKPGAPQELAFKREIYPLEDLVKLKEELSAKYQLSDDIKKVQKRKSNIQPKNLKSLKNKETEEEDSLGDSNIFQIDNQFDFENIFNTSLNDNFDKIDENLIEKVIPEIFVESNGQKFSLTVENKSSDAIIGESKTHSEFSKLGADLFSKYEGKTLSLYWPEYQSNSQT